MRRVCGGTGSLRFTLAANQLPAHTLASAFNYEYTAHSNQPILSRKARMMSSDNITHRRAGAPTIMVVDDTDGVRKIISMQLKTLGYRVIEATGGHEAVEL